jgi:hypothetical protein
MIFKRRLFPQPEEPMTARERPGARSSETPSRTVPPSPESVIDWRAIAAVLVLVSVTALDLYK